MCGCTLIRLVRLYDCLSACVCVCVCYMRACVCVSVCVLYEHVRAFKEVIINPVLFVYRARLLRIPELV